MSLSQLRLFFEYCSVPFENSVENRNLLKKQLLLELKGSADGFIFCGNKNWTKEEIEAFFNKDFSFDLMKFMGENYWFSYFSDAKQPIPKEIFSLKLDLVNELVLFQRLESENYLEQYIKRLKVYFREFDFESILALVKLLKVFEKNRSLK